MHGGGVRRLGGWGSCSGLEAMTVANRTRMIEAVQGLLEELCSPDLTLGRAKILRIRLYELLDALAPPGDGPEGQGGASRSRPGKGRETFPSDFTTFPSYLQGPCVG